MFVPRDALWSRLDAATTGSVTLLIAPPGSGKTLGVAGWLQHARAGVAVDRTAAWIQADQAWEAPRLQPLLETAASPGDAPDARGEVPRLVVIDDAHLLPVSAVRLLDTWLSHSPERLRVLLMSRWDLPLGRLGPQLLGQCTILRGDLLRLDSDECTALVRAHSGSQSDEVVSLIAARAQGWCAAAVLLARAVASSPDAVATAHRYADDDVRVADLVASEVFASLRTRERHLLLCAAHEGTITVGTAAHLSNDPSAGRVLMDLAATGLLVTRVEDSDAPRGTTGGPTDLPVGQEDHEAERRYAIHPLLAEVVRRRVVAGGVDVARAKSTVARAVALDVSRGERREAFRRLMAIDQPAGAAEVLADVGHTLVVHGRGGEVRDFGAHYPETVASHPQTWFFLGLERWFANDVPSALHWLDRVLADVPADLARGGAHEAQVVSARLMRARVGCESVEHAVARGQEFVTAHLARVPREAVPHLLIELGISQVWLGHVQDAEANLSHSLRISTELGMPALIASSMTHLASAFFLDGREHLCRQMAAQALAYIETRMSWQPVFAEHRARLLLQLTAISDLPLPDAEARGQHVAGSVHDSDLTVRFWQRVGNTRAALASGSVIEAERLLAVPLGLPEVPAHLRAVDVLEKGWLAFLAEDRAGLKTCVRDLEAIGYPGEVSLLRGLCADLDGDQRGAANHFVDAAERTLLAQPPYRAMSHVCAAQLLDALGHPEQADGHLVSAVSATGARRNAIPFLGWLRHGTPVHVLLTRLREGSSDSWVRELREVTAGFAGVAAFLSPLVSTAGERHTPRLPADPGLTPRERDVLQALARGATYADIAAHLVLSENTVKTHVRKLYGKLGATRRGEALSEARRLNLV